MIGALREWAQRYGETPTAIDWDRSSAYRQGGAAQVARLVEHPAPVPSVDTVLSRFDTCKAAVAAAGLQPRSMTRRLDADRLQQTVASYASALSTVEVAARLGIAPKTVRDRLHAAGVAQRPARPRADARETRAGLAASREHVSHREIADRLGISTHRVRSILKRHGLPGGTLVRQLRAQLARLHDLEHSARQHEVINLVVARRVGPVEAAKRLGVSPATAAPDLAASIRPQDADGTDNAADT